MEAGSTSTSQYGWTIDNVEGILNKGNMFLDFKTSWATRVDDVTKISLVDYSDYNVYVVTPFRVVLDFNGANVIVADTLAELNGYTIADASETLNVDNPDGNSITSTAAALFTDEANHDYTHKTTATVSPAIDLIGVGDSAGCYNTGTEIIGLDPDKWVS